MILEEEFPAALRQLKVWTRQRIELLWADRVYVSYRMERSPGQIIASCPFRLATESGLENWCEGHIKRVHRAVDSYSCEQISASSGRRGKRGCTHDSGVGPGEAVPDFHWVAVG